MNDQTHFDIINGLIISKIFKYLDPESAKLIKQYSVVRNCNEGDIILVEGERSESLYLLLSGEMVVTLDGEKIAIIDRVGEIVGELSLLSDKPCIASVQASKKSSLLTINISVLKEIAKKTDENFQIFTMKIITSILTERLTLTNEKAKNFEIQNRELIDVKRKLQKMNNNLEEMVHERTQQLEESTQSLEQKNVALTTSENQLNEKSQSEIILLKRMVDFSRDEMPNMVGLIEDLEKIQNDSSSLIIKKFRKEIDNLKDLLHPFNDIFKKMQDMKSKRILLVEEKKKQQVIAKMALKGTGVELDIASSVEEGKEFLNKNKCEIMIIGVEKLDLAQWTHTQFPNIKIVVMTSNHIQSYLQSLRENKYLSNIVSRDDEDRTFTVKNISTTISKVIMGDIFGLEKYLSWGVEVKNYPVKSSKERQELIENMSKYFKDLGMKKMVIERCQLVSEELLMNAIYDAPVDEEGNSKYNHLSRKEVIQLSSAEQADYRFACDGVLAAISVIDPFGGLSKEIIYDYLDSCFGGRAGSLNIEKGGAGRGLFMLIQNSDLVVFNVKPNEKTEVIALINVDNKNVKIEKTPTFHYFSL
tara:strand:+ start:1207 stop:2967 length:1761 start_codon:yes stop_codon:yes gene_type:complete